jgi:cathepsin D
MNFGSKTWPISPLDFNLGALDTRGTLCLGGMFDLDAGTNGVISGGPLQWVVGDTFLVRLCWLLLLNSG